MRRRGPPRGVGNYTGSMTRVRLVALAALLAFAASTDAEAQQRRRAPARKAPASKPVAAKTMTADITCPSLLGMGVKTIRSFCDVPAGRDPAQGVVITIPP